MSDRDRMIKLKVPTANDGSLIAETAFGTEELYKDSRENVMGRFVAIDSGDRCLAILNRGVYGNHFENGAIYLSLVRGVTYCAHPICDRELIPSDRFTKKIDQGENNYSFRLTVAKRELLLRKTQEFTMSPIALNIFPIKRENATLRDFPVSLSDTSVAITAIKKADGRDAIIFRLHNNTEDERSTYIEVAGERLLLTFGKYEVKTVLYESGTLKEYYELLI